MKKHTKRHISEIPEEHAHGGSGSRKMLVHPDHITSPYFEAWTLGYLPVGQVFDWHEHKDTDEVFIVIKGTGKFITEDEEIEYRPGDIITIPGNIKHKLVAEGSETNEFYFVRVKAK